MAPKAWKEKEQIVRRLWALPLHMESDGSYVLFMYLWGLVGLRVPCCISESYWLARRMTLLITLINGMLSSRSNNHSPPLSTFSVCVITSPHTPAMFPDTSTQVGHALQTLQAFALPSVPDYISPGMKRIYHHRAHAYGRFVRFTVGRLNHG
ncbi:hypothetical protein DFH05DRAFT_1486602 [Lentinula detonsa]|uniref:Uncharacterized protein n=1 Tax=Lentinula detonsa TaxID=2804962 RepID=A0A9W8P4M5_9AGAR|nr:hypothetical protein DFH05DRAFT_1486602 [Lentinula detonsa]